VIFYHFFHKDIHTYNSLKEYQKNGFLCTISGA
jgi:hypothetical protein